MKKFLLLFTILLFKCDSDINCDKDECGVCDGPGIEAPEFIWVYNAGQTCDCDGNVWDCIGICGGINKFGELLDCDGDCINFDIFDYGSFGDAWCDDNLYACNEQNCDDGDCGEWNGYQCLGGAGIKYDMDSYITNINSNDPSIPNSFYNDYYYEAIVGTYTFDYVLNWLGDDQFVYGYYTTYNQINDDNICFELDMGILGPFFWEWHPWFDEKPDCGTFFGYGNIQSQRLSEDRLEEYNKEVEKYNKYLSNKQKEQQILNEEGINKQNISNVTFNKIDDPQNNHRIMEIDNHPEVIVKKGDNFIFKYIKRNVENN